MKSKTGFLFYPIVIMGFVLILNSSCKKDNYNPPPYKLTDIDGNVYDSVIIGTQVWMLQNLKVTKYNTDAPIALVTDDMAWNNLSSPAYCWYNNDETANKNPYGALYNWWAVYTGILCPTGWHVPSEGEWITLINYLGGGYLAGGKLKETSTSHWLNPNTGATNESGFTALPGGSHNNNWGHSNMGDRGNWWTSTEYSSSEGCFYYMGYDFRDVYGYCITKSDGFSVRCLRN